VADRHSPDLRFDVPLYTLTDASKYVVVPRARAAPSMSVTPIVGSEIRASFR
jgi:hypothetical protein